MLDTSSSGATAFIEPFEAVELNNALAETAAKERHEIQRILRVIGAAFAEAAEELAEAVEVLGRLDAAQAAVLFGKAANGRIIFPEAGAELRLEGARHPLLDDQLRDLRIEVLGDAELRRTQRAVVPLDFALPSDVRTLVISGPNAGGKTVVLKTLGLMVLLCYHGIPIPVDAGTTIPAIDALWCHIGDEQDVTADLSTFSGAMAATARLLDDADEGALVLYDELGAGTDPLEGAALGCALLEALTRRGALTIATTHLASIAMVASSAQGFENAAMEYDEANERPTYHLAFGRPGRSRALEIANRMGIDQGVLGRAEELLGGDHLELDRWLRRLESLEQELIVERSALSNREAEIEKLRGDAQIELARLERERKQATVELNGERDKLRRRAKQQLDRVTAKLEDATKDLKPLGRRSIQKLRDEALDLGESPRPTATAEPEGPEVGARVRLVGLGGEGEIQAVRGSQVSVVIGNKRVWVPVTDIEIVRRPKNAPGKRVVHIEVTEEAPQELMLIGWTASGRGRTWSGPSIRPSRRASERSGSSTGTAPGRSGAWSPMSAASTPP